MPTIKVFCISLIITAPAICFAGDDDPFPPAPQSLSQSFDQALTQPQQEQLQAVPANPATAQTFASVPAARRHPQKTAIAAPTQNSAEDTTFPSIGEVNEETAAAVTPVLPNVNDVNLPQSVEAAVQQPMASQFSDRQRKRSAGLADNNARSSETAFPKPEELPNPVIPQFETKPMTTPMMQTANIPVAGVALSSQPADHPLARYLSAPDQPNSQIRGKAFSIAELLKGARADGRCRLLQAYWELSRRLVEYNVQRETNSPSLRVAELEFLKAQWMLAEQINRVKGIELQESELPIPSDYPLYQRYETYSKQLAKTDRLRHLARMVPIQQQLIEAKLNAGSMNQAESIIDLTQTIVEYNKLIAEYASETISPNVSDQQLVGAVIKLSRQKNTTFQNNAASVVEQPILQTSYMSAN